MDIIQKKWSCDADVIPTDWHNYRITTKNLQVCMEMYNEYRARLIIFLYYDGNKFRVYDNIIKGDDLLDKIDSLILKYDSLPDLINDVKNVLKEQLNANDIRPFKLITYANYDCWGIECYNEEMKNPFLKLQFKELESLSLLYHRIQVIDKYKYYVDIELHDISVNLYDIEQALSKTLNLQLQENKQEEE